MIKKILLTIVLLSAVIFAQHDTLYYVYTGGNNTTGKSWTNAWTSFSSIVWDSLQGGGYLYISGGADSAIYSDRMEICGNIKGTAANPIYIMAGKFSPSPSGHSGRVILDGGDYPDGGSNPKGNIYINCDQGATTITEYIYIKGIESRGAKAGFEIEGRSNVITFDSVTVYHWGDLAGILVQGQYYASTYSGCDSTIVKNSSFISDVLYPDTAEHKIGWQTDGLFFKGCTNTFIINNYIHLRAQDPKAHVDCIQSQQSQGFYAWNNVLINDSVYSPEGGGMPWIVRSGNAGNNEPVIIYNNFMYMGGAWWGTNPGDSIWWWDEVSGEYIRKAHTGANQGIVLNTHGSDQPTYPAPQTFIFHNTVIANGPQLNGVSLDYFGANNDGKGVWHNNIVAQFGSGESPLTNTPRQPDYLSWLVTFGKGGGITSTHIDSVKNNIWYKEWGNANFSGYFDNGGTPVSGFTFNYWKNTLGGTGQEANPLFVNNIGNEPDQGALRGYLTSSSPAINNGYDIRYLLTYIEDTWGIILPQTDIEGNERNMSNPTVGAYEYVAATDSSPAFSFVDVTNAELNSYHTAYAVFSGADTTFWVTAGSDSFKIDALGTFDVGIDTAHSGDTVYIAKTASGSYAAAVSVTVTAGGNSDTWYLTTKNQPVADVPKLKILIRK